MVRERELEHDGDSSLHVARSESLDVLAGASAGTVLLRGDRVEVTGEKHERTMLAAACDAGQHARVAPVADGNPTLSQDSQDMLDNVSLCAGLGGDVDELQRALCQAGSEVRCREDAC